MVLVYFVGAVIAADIVITTLAFILIMTAKKAVKRKRQISTERAAFKNWFTVNERPISKNIPFSCLLEKDFNENNS